jgi:short-subunit dehydrogenase involved in D-alanine esterification of teichoic acids
VFGCDFRDLLPSKLFADDLDALLAGTMMVNNAGIVTKLALEDDNDDIVSLARETLEKSIYAPRLLSHLALHACANVTVARLTGGGGGSHIERELHSREKVNEYMKPMLSASRH